MPIDPDPFWTPHQHPVRGRGERSQEQMALADSDGYITHHHPRLDIYGLSGHAHAALGLGKGRMTPENRRARQAAAGKQGRGPRRKPKPGDRVTSKGYVKPPGSTGQKKRLRNEAVTDLLDRCGWSEEDVAKAFGVKVPTIRHIRRYFE